MGDEDKKQEELQEEERVEIKQISFLSFFRQPVQLSRRATTTRRSSTAKFFHPGGEIRKMCVQRIGKKRLIRSLLYLLFSCLFFFSSMAFGAIEIGPIGYHWVVYDNGVDPDCVPDAGPPVVTCAPDSGYTTPLPDTVLIGARICNLSTTSSVTNLSVTFSWDPNGECVTYPTTTGQYTTYYSTGPGSGLYCRADRLWLESMPNPLTTRGYAVAWADIETKNCDMQTDGSCTSWTLTSGPGEYWERYDEMEEKSPYGTRQVAPIPFPSHCKDVYFNVSADMAALADLDNSNDPGGSVPFQISASTTETPTVYLTDVTGSPLPDNGDFAAAVATYEAWSDLDWFRWEVPPPSHFEGPSTVGRGDVVTYDFGWELSNYSVMHSTLDFPTDLFDIIHVRTEIWNSKSTFDSHRNDGEPISLFWRSFVSNRNSVDAVNINDNWFNNNSHYLGTFGGWYGYGIGDLDGNRDTDGLCDPTQDTVFFPAGYSATCNYIRQYTLFHPPTENRDRKCYYQYQDCNILSNRLTRSIFTVRAKRNTQPGDVIKWAQAYSEEGGLLFKYWYLVNELTYANIENFRVYEGAGTVVEWQTSSEDGTAGYDLYRLNSTSEKFEKINSRILPAVPGSGGGTYSFVDSEAIVGESYTYRLMEIEAGGNEHFRGPFEVTVEPASRQGTVSMIGRTDTSIGLNSDFNHTPRQVTQQDQQLNHIVRQSQQDAQNKKRQRKSKVTKLKVNKPGLYHISNKELADMLGVSLERVKKLITRNRLSLDNKGKSIPFLTNQKGKGGVYFFGVEEITNYADENVYWMKRGSKLKGQRHLIKKASLLSKLGMKGTSVDPSFSATAHAEEDNWALPAFFDNPEADYWMWDYHAGGYPDYATKQYPINVPSPVYTGNATLQVSLKGVMQKPDTGTHHAKVVLNDTSLGDVYFNSQDTAEMAFTFDASLLLEGANSIEVQAILDEGTSDSSFYVNSFDIKYERLYQAIDDTLFFAGGGNQNVMITGFSSAKVFVVDITDHFSPVVVEAKIKPDQRNGYKAAITSIEDGKIYLAVGEAGLAELADFFSDVPSGLKSTSNQVDYLVLAPSELLDGAQRLADYRESRGLRSLVVDIEDVMDEFNYGVSSPEAIRDFMDYAYDNWSKAPEYLVLIGNGTYDYKNGLGHGDNLMPVRLVNTGSGLFSSDTYYVDMVGNDFIPEIAVGRIPVRTAAELASYLDKLFAMENSFGQAERSKILMLADSPGEKADFVFDSDGISGFMPESFSIEKVYLSDMDLNQARARTIDALNEGVGFFNFVGHSGVNRLGQNGMLSLSDINSLSNVPFSPIMTWWTCVAGKYELPGYRGVAEALLLDDDGGASAIFASSGLSENQDSQRLGKFFYDNVSSMENATLGQVILQSKQQYANAPVAELSLLSTYNLLGDPAMPLQ